MIECDVVIIDSGVSGIGSFKSGVYIKKNIDSFVVSNDISDRIGHGTAIYTIISKFSHVSKIFIVKLDELYDDLDDTSLIAALQYIQKNVKCKVINISLGISIGDNIDKLYDICAEISAKGTVIVSAFDNEGCYSYPAAFDCVIGVDCKEDLKLPSEFHFVENSPINILAKGNPQKIKTKDGKVIIIGGSSVACAHISAILASNLKDNYSHENALLYLKSLAKAIFSTYTQEDDINNKFFQIHNAVVFPFSKEAEALLRFSDMIPFNIQWYCDVRQSGRVGRKLSSYFANIESSECIMDIERIDLTDVDTIRDYKKSLITKAIEMKINIYSFDPLTPYINALESAGIKYYYPIVKQKDVPQNTFGKLYKIIKPVVGIFGTSSQEGKFSLQLAIKKKLESYGYEVGTIGTEPHSPLFNFDCVFPMGYNSSVYLTNSEIVLYLNDKINHLCRIGKEIILCASQAQIVPYSSNNLLEIPSLQYHFALGTRPDAVLLCINYYDEIQYIRNSIYALVGLTDADVIALVMYPLTYSNDGVEVKGNLKRKITSEEFTQRADELTKEFHIPVFLLGEASQEDEICKRIIDFF